MWPALISYLLILTVLRSEEGSGICQFTVLILFLFGFSSDVSHALVVCVASKNILRTCDSVSTLWSGKQKRRPFPLCSLRHEAISPPLIYELLKIRHHCSISKCFSLTL